MIVLLLLACAGGDAADTGACDRDPPLDWAGFGQGWMEKHCTGCHSSLLPEGSRDGAPVGVDLDTWDDVVRWGPRVRARATGPDPTMPPGGGPSDEERALLSEWLTCAVLPAGEAR